MNPQDEMQFNQVDRYESDSMMIHTIPIATRRATLAIHLAEHLAIAAGKPDGEDSAGRAKLALMSPAEVAQRACEIADAMITEMDARGWYVRAPRYEPKTRI